MELQAKELHQWKMEEAIKFEELRSAEETALRLAEMEKAKCKAALEAADAAQRIAELEAKKRINAENKARLEAEEKKKALNALANTDIRYRKYTIDEIEAATGHFQDSLKIGEGGYGPVYKAYLDHTPVAIKVLRPDAAQGRKQFQQEVKPHVNFLKLITKHFTLYLKSTAIFLESVLSVISLGRGSPFRTISKSLPMS